MAIICKQFAFYFLKKGLLYVVKIFELMSDRLYGI